MFTHEELHTYVMTASELAWKLVDGTITDIEQLQLLAQMELVTSMPGSEYDRVAGNCDCASGPARP